MSSSFRTLILVTLLALLALLTSLSPWLGSRSVEAAIPSFHTPTGNIGCYAYGGYLRCDIGQKDWRGPTRPASCPLAYGDSLVMSANGLPRWGCHGDTALHSGPALSYGRTWHHGSFACTSRITGLTCTNQRGHGFFLSRQYYRLF